MAQQFTTLSTFIEANTPEELKSIDHTQGAADFDEEVSDTLASGGWTIQDYHASLVHSNGVLAGVFFSVGLVREI